MASPASIANALMGRRSSGRGLGSGSTKAKGGRVTAPQAKKVKGRRKAKRALATRVDRPGIVRQNNHTNVETYKRPDGTMGKRFVQVDRNRYNPDGSRR